MMKPKSKKGYKSVEDAGEQGICQLDDAQLAATPTKSVNLANIMEAIKSMNGSMNENSDYLESTLSQVFTTLLEVTLRVLEFRKACADVEDHISELEVHSRHCFVTLKN
ncbi:uncharacterized [Tachysurus ichikawai]